jgi:Flp pilus assembly protein TadD
LVVVAVGLLATACSRHSGSPPWTRLAIVRFENLGADPAQDWIGRAFTQVLSEQLRSAPGIYAIPPARLGAVERGLGVRPVSAPGVSTETAAAAAVGATRVAYGSYWTAGGRLHARLFLRGVRTGRDIACLRASASGTDVLTAAAELARQITPHPEVFGTHSPAALEAYSEALEAPDSAQMAAAAERAVAADPDFAPAYRLLAETQRGTDRAMPTLEKALNLRPALPALERSRIAVEVATLRGDAAGRYEALTALAHLTSHDPDLWRSVGEMALSRHDFRPAAQAFRHALEVEPDDTSLLNQQAYALAYSGDVEAASGALEKYRQLQPADPNPIDSLGDVNLINGRYQQAAGQYLEAVRKNPGFLGAGDYYKAAFARLLAGDPAGANTLARQYRNARAAAHDPAADFFDAEWQWTAGQPKPAFARLEALAQKAEAGPQRSLAARAYVRLAVWSLIAGDRSRAEEMARKARETADRSTVVAAAIAGFLAQPPMPAAEWKARALKLAPLAPEAEIRDYALAHALLLAHDFAGAGEVLERMYTDGEGASDEGLSVLLAECDLETGRTAEAASLLARTPVPPLNGLSPFAAFYFPTLLDLRARLAAQQGHAAEAKADAALFHQLAGK